MTSNNNSEYSNNYDDPTRLSSQVAVCDKFVPRCYWFTSSSPYCAVCGIDRQSFKTLFAGYVYCV